MRKTVSIFRPSQYDDSGKAFDCVFFDLAQPDIAAYRRTAVAQDLMAMSAIGKKPL
jgi:hypothetical protein